MSLCLGGFVRFCWFQGLRKNKMFLWFSYLIFLQSSLLHGAPLEFNINNSRVAVMSHEFSADHV